MRLKWSISKTDRHGDVISIKSGPWIIAKQGLAEVTYMLTHDADGIVGFFLTNIEARQHAEHAASYTKERKNVG